MPGKQPDADPKSARAARAVSAAAARVARVRRELAAIDGQLRILRSYWGDSDAPLLKTGRLLVLDDNTNILRLFHRSLGPEYEILGVTKIELARELLDHNRFEVVVSDYELGTLEHGLSFLAGVAQQHPAVQRVLMSGTTPAKLTEALENETIHRFLAKPFRVGELRQCLIGHL